MILLLRTGTESLGKLTLVWFPLKILKNGFYLNMLINDLYIQNEHIQNQVVYLTTSAINDNQTRVHWEFNGKMKYPMNLMMIFIHYVYANLKGILNRHIS